MGPEVQQGGAPPPAAAPDSAPPPGDRNIPWLVEGGVGSPDAPQSSSRSPAAAPPPSYTSAAASGHTDRRELDGRRIKARLIDAVVVGIPLYLAARALTKGEVELVRLGTELALVLTYFFVCESLTGQTLGKRLQGLRVMSVDYRPAQAGSVAARTVLRALEEPVLALISMFGSRERRQRIGDFAGRTIVARSHECLERPDPSPLLVVYPMLWIGAVLLVAAIVPRPDPVATDRAAFEAGLRASLTAERAPGPVVNCMVDRSREVISDYDLGRIKASAPYLATSGLAALDRPLRSRIFEMTFKCLRQTGYVDRASLPSDPGQRLQYVKCIERHAQPAGVEACRSRYGLVRATGG